MPRCFARRQGQSIIEVVAGIVVTTIVFLFLLDLTAVVLLASKLDAVAKSAARSAAKEKNAAGARSAAVQIIRRSLEDGRAMIENVRVPEVEYRPNNANKVSVRVSVVAKILVPVPGVTPTVDLQAKAVEPLVVVPD